MVFSLAHNQLDRAIAQQRSTWKYHNSINPSKTKSDPMSDSRSGGGLPINWAETPIDNGAQFTSTSRPAPNPESSAPDHVAGDLQDAKDEGVMPEDGIRPGSYLHALIRVSRTNLPTATAAMPIPALPSTNPSVHTRALSQSAPCTFERAETPNCDAAARHERSTSHPCLSLSSSSPNPPLRHHTAIFEEAHRPLLPNENMFEAVDPVNGWRRFHNLIGGFVANPGTEGRPVPVWDRDQEAASEPEVHDDGAFRPYRRSRGGEGRRRRRRRGAGAGRGRESRSEDVARRDEIAVGNTDLLYGGGEAMGKPGTQSRVVQSKGFSYGAADIAPPAGCKLGWQPSRRRDEPDDEGGMGAREEAY
ncbi:Nn.00g083180.m01.CDS01 [Neocucurbitaria sp. VM-36]